ncbi:MAG: cobamide remodeling phosphodiesterase CbiR [Desulfobacterales bacterium]
MTDHKNNFSASGLPYKPLPESFRTRFAFTIASPSFIYPDHVLPNARMLAPFIDEIELVFFEGASAGSLPPTGDIKKLADLSENTGITYNVHLPIDVSITDQDKKSRDHAIKTTAKAIERARLLNPSTWTLHLPYTGRSYDAGSITDWQKLAGQSAERLLGITGISSRSISVETLDFPPAWLEPVAEKLDLSVCLDVGHLIEHGYDITETFKRLGRRISILHLYGGVEAGRGHIGLKHLPWIHAPAVSKILSSFKGTVCLEVFSRKDLEESLNALLSLVGPGRSNNA